MPLPPAKSHFGDDDDERSHDEHRHDEPKAQPTSQEPKAQPTSQEPKATSHEPARGGGADAVTKAAQAVVDAFKSSYLAPVQKTAVEALKNALAGQKTTPAPSSTPSAAPPTSTPSAPPTPSTPKSASSGDESDES
jgi:hypothetical protein